MRLTSVLLAFIMTFMTVTSSFAQSKMISTLEVMDTVSVDSKREQIISFIEKDHVQKELIKMGINPQEAVQRVAGLSHEEVRTLSQEIEKAPAGGNVLGTVIGAGLFVFVVLLVTDILGFTKVFSFTRSIR